MFERRLIEKYIAENGVDPITNDVLSEEQLIDIKGILNTPHYHVFALDCVRSKQPHVKTALSAPFKTASSQPVKQPTFVS